MPVTEMVGRIPPLVQDIVFPSLPVAAFVGGLALVGLFAYQALRPPRARPSQIAIVPATPTPTSVSAPAPLAGPRYKPAPVSIHFPQIPRDFPDVWGIGESFEVAFQIDDPPLARQPDAGGLTLAIDGEPLPAAFTKGTLRHRHLFRSLGEKTLTVDQRIKGESLPRRTERILKIVEYRQEIADVFANFREEASRSVVPIREDATPWEIYDLLTGANPKIPAVTLRDIITSFEEAKYSNHPVTRRTYEKMIGALLKLESAQL